MALSPAEWAALAATISAMADVYQIGKETFQTYFERRILSEGNVAKAQALQRSFGTYSDQEVESVEERIEECRKRFIKEGSGQSRKNCLCSVLIDVMLGNGGTIPDPEWSRLFEALRCTEETAAV